MDTHTEQWHRVGPEDVPDEGRVRTVTVDGRSIALTRCGELDTAMAQLFATDGPALLCVEQDAELL